jgi:IS5 family transposase
MNWFELKTFFLQKVQDVFELIHGLRLQSHIYQGGAALFSTDYVQYFTGETYFQPESPLDSSSLTRWRKRIGEEGVETLLMVSIEAARRIGMMKAARVDHVIVDITVMPKAVAYPTDSRLLEKSRQHLVKLANEHQIDLRQNYNREAPRLAAQVARYAHAKQYKRMPNNTSA